MKVHRSAADLRGDSTTDHMIGRVERADLGSRAEQLRSLVTTQLYPLIKEAGLSSLSINADISDPLEKKVRGMIAEMNNLISGHRVAGAESKSGKDANSSLLSREEQLARAQQLIREFPSFLKRETLNRDLKSTNPDVVNKLVEELKGMADKVGLGQAFDETSFIDGRDSAGNAVRTTLREIRRKLKQGIPVEEQLRSLYQIVQEQNRTMKERQIQRAQAEEAASVAAVKEKIEAIPETAAPNPFDKPGIPDSDLPSYAREAWQQKLQTQVPDTRKEDKDKEPLAA